jgi:hypothetical protein
MANAAATADSDSDDDYCGRPVKQDISDQIVQVFFTKSHIGEQTTPKSFRNKFSFNF